MPLINSPGFLATAADAAGPVVVGSIVLSSGVLPNKHILWDCEWGFGARIVPAIRASFLTLEISALDAGIGRQCELALLSFERVADGGRGDDLAAIAEVADRLLDQFRGNIVGEGAGANGADIALALLRNDCLQVGAT